MPFLDRHGTLDHSIIFLNAWRALATFNIFFSGLSSFCVEKEGGLGGSAPVI